MVKKKGEEDKLQGNLRVRSSPGQVAAEGHPGLWVCLSSDWGPVPGGNASAKAFGGCGAQKK